MRLRIGCVSTPVPQTSASTVSDPSRYAVVITGLGIAQIFAWGSSYYLLAVLAKPIARDTGWPFPWIIGGVSLGLLIAGLVSPLIGGTIARHGGRPVLAISAITLAAGLALLGCVQSLPAYLLAWMIIGLGMGAGLYDPAFATLGRLYGQAARPAITTLTLFGGFASTVCWPLSAFLVTHLGWREACWSYAAIHLFVLVPLYLFALPREVACPRLPSGPMLGREGLVGNVGQRRSLNRLLFGLVAVAITLSAMISTLLSVHLLTILQSRGLALGTAVALGALVGPCQVGARTIEFFIARYHHPIWTKVAATSLVALGVVALWVSLPILALPLVCYGAGIGLESIARGTLPLALFPGPGYAVTMGRLAMPSLIVQAAAPSIGAVLLSGYGANATLGVLTGVAAVNVIFALAILTVIRLSSSRL